MTSDEVCIEPAEVCDAEAILSLQRLAYESEARLYGDWSIPPLRQTLEEMRGNLRSETVLKAVLDGAIVGSVRAHVEGDTCQVGRLIVHPGHQRRGIGSRLMAAIEAVFPAAVRFELFTGSRSEGNIRLYERLGYRIHQTRQLSERVTLVFMEKRAGAGAA